MTDPFEFVMMIVLAGIGFFFVKFLVILGALALALYTDLSACGSYC